MKFRYVFKEIDEEMDLNENYTIKNLLDDLEFSSETLIVKQNGDLAIEDSVINDGDRIELVQVIYGG